MKLNLGDFKKVKSEKDCTTLRHPKGHEIKISHSALSPKMREQLHALPMADGGPVPEASGKPDKGPSIGSKQDRAAVSKGVNESGDFDAGKAWQNVKTGLGFAEGGGVKPVPGSKYPTSEAAARGEGPMQGPANSNPQPVPGSKYPSSKGEYGGAPKGGSRRSMNGDDEEQFADGGPVSQSAQDSPDAIASDAAASQPQQTSAAQQQAPVVVNVNPAPQGQSSAFPGSDANAHDALQAAQAESTRRGDAVAEGIKNLFTKPIGMQPGQQSALGIAIPNSEQGAPQQPQAGIAAQPPGAPANMPQPAQPNPMDQYGDMLGKGLHEQEAGIMQGAQAEGQLGQMQAAQLQNGIAQQQQMMGAYQQHYDALDKERQAFQKDVQDQHIDPQHYMNSQSTGQKIKTAIGMIVAGAGSGVLHQENPVIKYVNQQISNDIDAQKAELGKKENLLAANMKQFGNLHDASLMTQVMQRDIVANQMNQAIAKMADPIAKSKALQQVGQLHSQNALLMSQLAASRTLSGSQGNVDSYLNMMRVVNPERAKELEARYVPGVGIASVPVTGEIRDKIVAHQQLDDAAKDLQQWSATHSTIVPGTADYNVGAQKAQTLQQLIRHGLLGTVYREGEQPLLDKMVNSNPAGFFKAFQTQPKLRELVLENARQFDTLKKSYGFQGAPGAQQQSQGFQPKSFRPIGK